MERFERKNSVAKVKRSPEKTDASAPAAANAAQDKNEEEVGIR